MLRILLSHVTSTDVIFIIRQMWNEYPRNYSNKKTNVFKKGIAYFVYSQGKSFHTLYLFLNSFHQQTEDLVLQS